MCKPPRYSDRYQNYRFKLNSIQGTSRFAAFYKCYTTINYTRPSDTFHSKAKQTQLHIHYLLIF